VAPVNDTLIEADRTGYEHFHINPDWRTFREYFARLEKQGMGINLASYVARRKFGGWCWGTRTERRARASWSA